MRNAAGEPIAMPGQPWTRPRANAAIEMRGIYVMANQSAGLILQVTALQLDGNPAQPNDDPFAN